MQYTLLTGGGIFCFTLESVSGQQVMRDEERKQILYETQFKVLP
jgi:hypothetical protein